MNSWKTNLNQISSQWCIVTSLNAFQRRFARIRAQDLIYMINWWRTKCELWVIKYARDTKWTHLEPGIPASSIKNNPRGRICQLTWTMEWSQWKTRMLWISDMLSRKLLSCINRCKTWCQTRSLNQTLQDSALQAIKVKRLDQVLMTSKRQQIRQFIHAQPTTTLTLIQRLNLSNLIKVVHSACSMRVRTPTNPQLLQVVLSAKIPVMPFSCLIISAQSNNMVSMRLSLVSTILKRR